MFKVLLLHESEEERRCFLGSSADRGDADESSFLLLSFSLSLLLLAALFSLPPHASSSSSPSALPSSFVEERPTSEKHSDENGRERQFKMRCVRRKGTSFSSSRLSILHAGLLFSTPFSL